ncbi:probable O-methyltransferase 3 [Quercus robur]|uniref:probable O-methyltransferase 3 n=1 Tax=Quercus robur TaxID=38942 RepID=UPI002162A13F|nr:probable O-methyltransferase 3 [Quercus robur]
MSVKCAIELGIPDIIHNHGKPMTLSELITALPIHPTKSPHVYRLMRILIHSGFFAPKNTNENDQEEVYVLTESSRLLIKDNPLSVTPFLLAMVDPMLTTPRNYLTTWFQNEDLTPFDMAHEKTFWDYGGDEPKFANIFNDAMASDARLVMSIVVDKCKGVFEGLKSFVDVGDGTGTVTKAIADTFPDIECTVFDLPPVVADFQGSKNLKYVGGDMFEAVPPADAVFRKLAPSVGKTATCKPYKRFPDKELHGTYSLDGSRQQRSGRRATTYYPGETGPNPYSGSGTPH